MARGGPPGADRRPRRLRCRHRAAGADRPALGQGPPPVHERHDRRRRLPADAHGTARTRAPRPERAHDLVRGRPVGAGRRGGGHGRRGVVLGARSQRCPSPRRRALPGAHQRLRPGRGTARPLPQARRPPLPRRRSVAAAQRPSLAQPGGVRAGAGRRPRRCQREGRPAHGPVRSRRGRGPVGPARRPAAAAARARARPAHARAHRAAPPGREHRAHAQHRQVTGRDRTRRAHGHPSGLPVVRRRRGPGVVRCARRRPVSPAARPRRPRAHAARRASLPPSAPRERAGRGPAPSRAAPALALRERARRARAGPPLRDPGRLRGARLPRGAPVEPPPQPGRARHGGDATEARAGVLAAGRSRHDARGGHEAPHRRQRRAGREGDGRHERHRPGGARPRRPRSRRWPPSSGSPTGCRWWATSPRSRPTTGSST